MTRTSCRIAAVVSMASDAVPFFGSARSRHDVLTYNLVHANEHYGNLVTYMRVNGTVRPSSRPRGR